MRNNEAPIIIQAACAQASTLTVRGRFAATLMGWVSQVMVGWGGIANVMETFSSCLELIRYLKYWWG